MTPVQEWQRIVYKLGLVLSITCRLEQLLSLDSILCNLSYPYGTFRSLSALSLSLSDSLPSSSIAPADLSSTSKPSFVSPSIVERTFPGAVATTATLVSASKSGRKYFFSAAKTSDFVIDWNRGSRSMLWVCDKDLRDKLTKDSTAYTKIQLTTLHQTKKQRRTVLFGVATRLVTL